MRYKPQRLHLIAILSIVLTIGVGYAVADSRILLTQDPGQSANPILIETSDGTDRMTVDPDGDIWSDQNYAFDSGVAFTGILDHTISADRTWTLPDKAGTFAMLADTGGGGSGNGLNTTVYDFVVYQDAATGNTIAEFGNGTEYLNNADDGIVIRGVADQGGSIYLVPATYTVTAEARAQCGQNVHLYLWNNTHFYGGGINNTIIDFTSNNNGATEHCSADVLSFNISFHDMSFNCPPGGGGGDCMRLRLHENYIWENVSFYGSATHIIEMFNGINTSMENIHINNYGTGTGILFGNQSNFNVNGLYIDNNLTGNHCLQQKREGTLVSGMTMMTNVHLKDCGDAGAEHGMRLEFGNLMINNLSIDNPRGDGINIAGANNTLIINNGWLNASSNTQAGNQAINVRNGMAQDNTFSNIKIYGNGIWEHGIETSDGGDCVTASYPQRKCLRDLTFDNIWINDTTSHGVLFGAAHNFKLTDSTVRWSGSDAVQILAGGGFCTMIGNTFLNWTAAPVDDDGDYPCIGITDPAGAGTMNQCAGGNC